MLIMGAVAAPDQTIQYIRVSNVRDSSFAVSWSTDVAADGLVDWGTSPGLGNTTADAESSVAVHYVTINGLSPNTTYYFQVRSGSSVDNNNGAFYIVTTGPILTSSPGTTVYGQVFVGDSATPAAHAIVYLMVLRTAGDSQLASARTDASGYWHYSLDNLRTASFQAKFNPVAGDSLSMNAYAGPSGYKSRMAVAPGSTSSVGNITVGGPLAVTFATMDAAAAGDAIMITWDTISEIDTLGFNLYRDTSADGPGIKLNSSLISAETPGSPEGHRYSYRDVLAAGRTCFYWLEDVRSTGVTERHGPVSATIPANSGPSHRVLLPLVAAGHGAPPVGLAECAPAACAGDVPASDGPATPDP